VHGERLRRFRNAGRLEIEAGGDSGIYLRGSPQVQIWDYTKNPSVRAPLYNNQKNPKDP